MVIVSALSPAHAENVHPNVQPLTPDETAAEISTLFGSKLSVKSASVIESKPSTKPDPSIKQTASLLAEPPIAPRSVESLEANPLSNAIAQTETPPPLLQNQYPNPHPTIHFNELQQIAGNFQ